MIENNLKVFYPESANYQTHPELAFSAAGQFPKQLLELAGEQKQIKSISDFKEAPSLGEMFDRYGSDKNTHGYAPCYAELLKMLGVEKELDVLEIGLGTNNPSFISTMGGHGKPGASVKAFKEYLKNANIYGADLDKSILFEEERIKTAFVDQTKLDTFDQMCNALGKFQFDMIVDDGLHSSEANINTLIFAMKSLKNNGWVVIEDIPERTLDVWHCVNLILGKNAGTIVKAKRAHLFVWQKTA